jgi:hypothetical protein
MPWCVEDLGMALGLVSNSDIKTRVVNETEASGRTQTNREAFAFMDSGSKAFTCLRTTLKISEDVCSTTRMVTIVSPSTVRYLQETIFEVIAGDRVDGYESSIRTLEIIILVHSSNHRNLQ